jgi:hypothetical protein
VTPDFACILALFSRSGKTGCGFINEDKPFQIQRWLFFPEGIMGRDDIVPVLLGGMDALLMSLSISYFWRFLNTEAKNA